LQSNIAYWTLQEGDLKTPHFGGIKMNNLLRNTTIFAVAALLGLFGVSAATAGTVEACAAANPTTPGNTTFPVDCTGMDAGTLLADLVSPFSYSTTSGTNSGTIESAVYDDGGTLDFYYQVTNDISSATALARLTATDFGSWATNTAFRTDGSSLSGTTFVDGTNPPVTSDSNIDGTVIGFSFYPPTTPTPEIGPGQESTVLIISTNATHYDAGNASIIDGGTDTVAAFQPSSGVPEPSTLGLLGMGLIAVVGLRKRFSQKTL
jgi:hypothetical protein